MRQRPFIKKKEPRQNRLRHICLHIVLPVYSWLVGLIIIVFIILGATNSLSDEILSISAVSAAAAVLIVSLSIAFVLLPFLRVKQAETDFASYDFSPYEADSEITFEALVPTEKYYFDGEPFDESERITLRGGRELYAYSEQAAHGNCMGIELLRNEADINGFFLTDLTDDQSSTQFVIDKNTDENFTSFTVSEAYSVTFRDDCAAVNGINFDYGDVSATVEACMSYYSVRIILYMFFGKNLVAGFTIGGKIASAIEKFGINVTNREVYEYIMRDPMRAFRQTALQQRLKKLK